MEISVVIPTLDEGRGIAQAIESASETGIEILVVDGGSQDETVRIAREAGACVLAGERGRARQLRLGSEKARGDAIVFLHADTELPAGWPALVRGALADPECAGGAFGFRFAERGFWEGWIEFWVGLRVSLFALPYGDQAIFVRRGVLEAMGGVPLVPVMEDLDLVQGIKRAGRIACLAAPVKTSSRRYREDGPLQTIARHAAALFVFGLGLDRTRLARFLKRGAARSTGRSDADDE